MFPFHPLLGHGRSCKNACCQNEVDFCASSRVKIARESDGGLSESEGGGGVDWSLSHRDFCICQPTRPRSALPQVLPLGKSHLGRRARCRSQRVKLFGLEVNRRKGWQQGGGSDCAKMNWRPSEAREGAAKRSRPMLMMTMIA